MKKLLLIILFSIPPIGRACVGSQELGLKVDGSAFFRDNEYDSDIQQGYSLPGARLTTALTYNPIKNIHLELGAHGLFFNGANKYPNYAYHDIGTWKGNQYQSGVHLLPWLRAEASIGRVSFVLGDIYGDVNHRFITPLYNKEQQFSADPEAGFQILADGRWGSIDAFVNWQSYQFKEDTHQEAFTVGMSSEFHLFKWIRIPLQILLQHRGGEQDKSELGLGVQTISNGSIGIGTKPFSVFNPKFSIEGEADFLGCYQQAGDLWPFSSGIAFHQMVKASLNLQPSTFNLQVGCLEAPDNFVSLFGNPFFSTISLKYPGVTYSGITTGYIDLGWHHTWLGTYTLGADLETFLVAPGASKTNFAFAAQVYLRFCPYFKLYSKHKG